MEEILKELVSSSSKKQSLNKQQLYFNLNSTRNWIQPNSLEISSKLKTTLTFAQFWLENNGCPGAIGTDETDDEMAKSKQIFSASFLLDIVQRLNRSYMEHEHQNSKFLEKLEAELIEFITPPDGLAMSNLESHFVLHCEDQTFDMTAMAISVLYSTGSLGQQPARAIAGHLREDLLERLRSEDEDTLVDPIECCTVLRLLFQVEDEAPAMLQEHLLDYLEQRLYLDDSTVSNDIGDISPDVFLYFLSQAVACAEQETELHEPLEGHLRERLGAGLGFQTKGNSVKATDIAMRIISLQLLGLLEDKEVLSSVTAGELKSLMKLQRSDGSWPEDGPLLTIGTHCISGTMLSSLLCAAALDSVVQLM